MENSSLQDQPTFEYDETGKITGYKTKVGADTVFPFNSLDGLTGELIGSNTKSVKVTKDLCGILFLAKYMGWYDYYFYKNGNQISRNASAVIGDSSGQSSYFGSTLIIEDFKAGDTFSVTTNSNGACRIVGLVK